MNRLALWALCAFAFTVPLENTITIEGVGTAARIVGYVAFGVCLWCVLLRGRVHTPDTIHVLWTAFVLLVVFSLAWTIDTEMTIARIVTYLQLLAMMWLISEVASSSANQDKLVTWLVIGATVSAIATLHSYWVGDVFRNSTDPRYAAEGFDPNDLALTFALAIPSAWYLSQKLHRFWTRKVLHASLLLLIIGILLTGSRGGVLAGAAAILIVPACTNKRSVGATTLVVIAAVIGVLAIVPAKTWDRIFTIRDAIVTGTMTGRTEIWSAGLKQFYEHPALGVGAGAYSKGVDNILPGATSAAPSQSVAHNTFLSILVELGIAGIGLFLLILVLTCRRILSLPQVERRLWAISLLAWCIGVCGLTWEYRKMTWILFAIIVAQARAFRSSSPGKPEITGPEPLWPREEAMACD